MSKLIFVLCFTMVSIVYADSFPFNGGSTDHLICARYGEGVSCVSKASIEKDKLQAEALKLEKEKLTLEIEQLKVELLRKDKIVKSK